MVTLLPRDGRARSHEQLHGAPERLAREVVADPCALLLAADLVRDDDGQREADEGEQADHERQLTHCTMTKRPNGPFFSGRKSRSPTRAPRSSRMRRTSVSFSSRSSHSTVKVSCQSSSRGRWRIMRPFVAAMTTGREAITESFTPTETRPGEESRHAAARFL